MVGLVEMVVKEVIHQVLGHTGLKPVLSLDTCMDQTTDVKITSSHLVVYTVIQLLPIHLPAQTNVDQDTTLHILQI